MTSNQQLAAHCRDVIANPQDHLDWVVDMARVALASLEAEPVGWTDEDEIRDLQKGGVGYLFKNDEGSNKFADPSRMLLIYTAPPAPEIKLPDLGSTQVNDAAWKLHDELTGLGPLNGHQFNNLKGCMYEAFKVLLGVKS